jgi:hypothetical protein
MLQPAAHYEHNRNAVEFSMPGLRRLVHASSEPPFKAVLLPVVFRCLQEPKCCTGESRGIPLGPFMLR